MAKPTRLVQAKEERFIPISPLMIFPEVCGDFNIYLKKGEHHLLFSARGEEFSQRHKITLYENGVEEIYIAAAQEKSYLIYLEQNLGRILNDDGLPLEERSKIFHHSCTASVKAAMQSKLPTVLDVVFFENILNVVRSSLSLLSARDGLKTIASLMSHDYRTYSHCVNVFIYAMSILETFGIDREEKLHYGLGAILHDIGKLRISPMVLNKPGNLTNAEWELVKTHPVEGVGLCTRISLSQAAINCILFHHEKYDGSGYPVGLAGENIPFPARVTAVADVYDALTTKRVYGEARTPYEALMEMKGEMNQAFEPEILKRLVLVLSGAEIIKGGDGLV